MTAPEPRAWYRPRPKWSSGEDISQDDLDLANEGCDHGVVGPCVYCERDAGRVQLPKMWPASDFYSLDRADEHRIDSALETEWRLRPEDDAA